MKKILLILALGLGLYGVYERNPQLFSPAEQHASTDGQLREAFEQRRSDLQIEGKGVVAKVLRDDLKGSRHQRFILRTADGLSLLVAHNIDLAPRIDGLREGDEVGFFGEYEWNAKGGVIHWTHHDPAGRHVGGWLKHKGRTYE
ncbi:hypothetical protein D9M68_648700 [compost metagenome]